MIETVATIALAFLGLALLLALYRLILGPRTPDRAVSIDLLTSIFIGIIAVYGIATGSDLLLDIALVSALLSFLGTVAFGFFLERNR